jgi:general secretion pathway protein I
MTRRRRAARGFTLVEILVALAIVAVALAAGMRALAQSVDGASALKARTLAQWVAQDRLAHAQLAMPSSGAGTNDGDAVQAGMRFLWRETVTATPNAAFRKIEIVVARPDAPDYALARLVGYLGESRPRAGRPANLRRASR